MERVVPLAVEGGPFQGQAMHLGVRYLLARGVLPFVQGRRPNNWRHDFFYEHHTMTKVIPELEGVRTERWKYVRWVTTSPLFEELYDLKSDPDELRNLANDPRHQKQLTTLRERWKELSEMCK